MLVIQALGIYVIQTQDVDTFVGSRIFQLKLPESICSLHVLYF